MKRILVFGILAALAICGCQVKEEGEFAPEGKVFALTGTVTKDHYCYLGVFDGDTNKTVLIYDSERNQAVSVGPVVSTGNVLTVQFQVDSEVAQDGLDLTVSVIDPPVLPFPWKLTL